jgi:hypothetical protein
MDKSKQQMFKFHLHIFLRDLTEKRVTHSFEIAYMPNGLDINGKVLDSLA